MLSATEQLNKNMLQYEKKQDNKIIDFQKKLEI